MEAYYLAHKVHRTESRKTEIQKYTNTQKSKGNTKSASAQRPSCLCALALFLQVHSSKKSDQTNNVLEKQRKGLILKKSTQNMFQHSY